ncbi:hypothetical protein DSECCO2_613570 [anaerobic digester metagenome]
MKWKREKDTPNDIDECRNQRTKQQQSMFCFVLFFHNAFPSSIIKILVAVKVLTEQQLQ